MNCIKGVPLLILGEGIHPLNLPSPSPELPNSASLQTRALPGIPLANALSSHDMLKQERFQQCQWRGT